MKKQKDDISFGWLYVGLLILLFVLIYFVGKASYKTGELDAKRNIKNELPVKYEACQSNRLELLTEIAELKAEVIELRLATER